MDEFSNVSGGDLGLGSLRAELSADNTEFAKGFEDSILITKKFESEMTEMQQRINNLFSRSGLGANFTEQIQKQYDARLQLEDQLYNVTHSYKDIALRDNERYFNDLRIQFRDNESMLTLITETETAKRKKILEDYAFSYQRFNRSIGMFVRGGIVTYLAAGVLEATTEIHKAVRQGGSSFQVFEHSLTALVHTIPVLNRLGTAIEHLTSEFTGLSEALEKLERVKKWTEGIDAIQKDLSRSLEMLGTRPENRVSLQIWYDYQDRLESITKLEEQWTPALRRNAEIRKEIAKLEKEGLPSKYPALGALFGMPENLTATPEIIEKLKKQIEEVPNIGAMKRGAAMEYMAAQEDLIATKVEAINQQIQEQINLYGKTTGQVELYKAELAGANEYQLADLKILADKLDLLEKEKKQQEEIRRASETRKQLLGELDNEFNMLGMINEERERAIKLTEFLAAAEIEYGKNSEKYMAAQAEYMSKLDKLFEGRRGWSAFTIEIKQWASDASNVFQNLGEIAAHTMDSISESIAQMVMEGKADFRDLLKSVLADIMTMLIRYQMAQVIMGIAGAVGIGQMFAGLGGGLTPGSVGGTPIANPATANVAIAHSGWEVGSSGVSRMSVPTWLFNNAPRLHTGLREDEYPAILQRGETVLPAGKGTPRVVVNITNNSKAQVEQEQQAPSFDGENYVVGVVLKDIRSRGRIHSALKGNDYF